MFDIKEHKREVYIVLEYMQGGEFTKRILSKPMSEDLTKFYFLQMIWATQYLHSQGVIHRDLKVSLTQFFSFMYKNRISSFMSKE